MVWNLAVPLSESIFKKREYMKIMKSKLLLAAMLILTQTIFSAAIKHRFLAVDNGLNKLLLVDEIDNKGWSISIPSGSRDLQLLSGNKVLVSHGDGAAEYDLTTGAKGWFVSGYTGVSTARRLANGLTLLGASDANSVTLYKVASDKTEKSKKVISGIGDLRLLRPLENGNFLLSLAAAHKVVEVDSSGKIVWNADLTDKGYLAIRLPNGHTLATSGQDCRLYDIDTAGKATLKVGSLEKFPSSGLLWFSGFEVLQNGHFFIANWNGHGMEGKGPHAIEFDESNNLVWKWEDHTAATDVTNVLSFESTTTKTHKSIFSARNKLVSETIFPTPIFKIGMGTEFNVKGENKKGDSRVENYFP